MKETEYPYRLPVVREGELVELTDSRDRPLMVVPRMGVRKLGLIRRVVLVALRDAQHRIYVQRRAATCDSMPDCWDLSATGHVHAGESREDAARRELQEEIGVYAARLIRLAERSPTAESQAFSTLYMAGPLGEHPVPNPEEVSDGMFLDEDELVALMAHDPEHITGSLEWAARSGLLFRQREDNV